MANFKVAYEIEVDAKNAVDAALTVEYLLNHATFRPSLKVTDSKGIVSMVDLEIMNNES